VSAYSDKSDLELAHFIVQSNESAFAELVNRHTDRFFALAYRTLHNQSDAEDVVQTAFIKFWQQPRLWNADKSKFTTWFYRVIINACHDLQRKSVRQRSLESSLTEQSDVVIGSEESSFDQRQSDAWRKHCVESGFRSLPASQRDALNLVVYCEITQKEAAEILGIKLKALESILHRAKKNLANYVQQKITDTRIESNLLESKFEEVSCHEK